MRSLVSVLSSFLLVIGFATPANSESTEWSAYQKTLATYSGSTTSLSSLQRSQIRDTLEKNPSAEKFICTGIRYYDQPMSVNIMVRKRAKEACAYAKQLNPGLSTWFQNKPTRARSYAGKVLLTVKSPLAKNVASPSDVEVCKVEDGMSPELLARGRGSEYKGQKARGPVGFPWVSANYFPTEGDLDFLMLLVSFEDTRKFTNNPRAYWAPQTKNLSDWVDHFSQGKMNWDFTSASSWIDLPYPSTEAPFSDADLARDIINRLPGSIDVNDMDAIVIQWAPGIKQGTRNRFSLRLNSIDSSEDETFEFRQMIWSPDFDFYQNDYEVRRDNIWGSLIHEMLHEMNMNLHGPGNGWGTGVGQSYRANQVGGVSYALSAWEQFLLGWMPDSQVHCVSPSDLDTEQSVMLTPLEIPGGDRRALVVPISNSDVLVVESRRPVGVSASWDSENSGLLAYTVNPQTLAQRDHIDEDCGNDPTHTKWAYYLFPDQEKQEASGWCGAMGGYFYPAVIDPGETLTHNGVKVELVRSSSNRDFVSVTRSSKATGRPATIDLGPEAPNGGWWNDCDGDCPIDLPNPAENFGHTLPILEKNVPKLSSCQELRQKGLRNGIAASREFRDAAGAAIATTVSTQWYAKNRAFDTNLDGVLCSCQAPESNKPGSAAQVDYDDCITLQADQNFDLDGGECGENWWVNCFKGNVALPEIAENSNHGRPVDDPDRIGPPSCQGLAESGLASGIAASFDYRQAAGARSAMVSTQWYATLYFLDTNEDGVLCSTEAPERVSPSTSSLVGSSNPKSPLRIDLNNAHESNAVVRYPRWTTSCSCCG